MAVAAHRLVQNRFILLTSVLAVSAWIIAFAGAVSIQKLYGAWWIVIYEAFIVTFSILLFTTNTMMLYRHSFLTFLAASIPLLTIQADYVIQYTTPSVPLDGANAYAAGYIILVCVQYMWVVVFGSDPNSYFGMFGQIQEDELPTDHRVPADHPIYMSSEKHLDDVAPVADKRIVMPPYPTATPVSAVPTENIPISPPPPQQQPHSEYLPPAVEYYEKVEALHAYKANAEDPNELSFEKGEVLEVVDRKGNWWQARKNTGAIGIIPSNYFAPSSANST